MHRWSSSQNGHFLHDQEDWSSTPGSTVGSVPHYVQMNFFLDLLSLLCDAQHSASQTDPTCTWFGSARDLKPMVREPTVQMGVFWQLRGHADFVLYAFTVAALVQEICPATRRWRRPFQALDDLSYSFRESPINPGLIYSSATVQESGSLKVVNLLMVSISIPSRNQMF